MTTKGGELSELQVRKVSEIVFRDDLYPRLKLSPETVQKYAVTLDVLPPIEINQHNEVIDGIHRWTAHRKEEREEIAVTVTETASDSELLEFAICRNAAFGLQLSNEDKQAIARRIYHETRRSERGEKKKHLAAILSVSESTIIKWTSRIDKDTKEQQKKDAFDLWLRMHTQEEIAERVDAPKKTIADWLETLGDFDHLVKSAQTRALHETEDFSAPVYNIWKQQTKTDGVTHHGNSEVRWLDNLLYLYTQPFDAIVDPFAGSGTTLDLCRRRLRRVWIGDRKPVVERENEIREHDLVLDGLPPLHKRWGDVRLVYLDPPYWKQAEGEYSDDPTDLANMELDEFHETLAGIIDGFAGKIRNARIALMLQPTQWRAPEHAYTDHVAEMLRRINLPIEMRFSVPYESQQGSAQMVNWAKEKKACLVLTREIVVWRVAP